MAVPVTQCRFHCHVGVAASACSLYRRHAHYTLGLTPLVLAWKDEGCSGYVVDTDASGNVPTEQQVQKTCTVVQ